MKINKLIFFVMPLVYVFWSCNNNGKNHVYYGEPVFDEDYGSVLYADTNCISLNQPITYTTKVKPLYKGSARLSLSLSLQIGTPLIFPNLDTLEEPCSRCFRVLKRIYFDKDSIFEQNFSIVILDTLPHQLATRFDIYCDSIYVPDSNRYYYIDSPEVDSTYGWLSKMGWGPPESLILTPCSK